MSEAVKSMLAKPIQLADHVAKAAGAALSYRAECTEIKTKAEHLASLLRQAARSDLYERPAVRVTEETAQALSKALSLISKCRDHNGILRRLFNIIPAGSFPRVVDQLDNSIQNVSWLIRISSPDNDPDGESDLHGLPNIAQNEPILFLIWDHIAKLHTGSPEARADSASNLASMARDNDHFARKIIEEDGVAPLLRLLKESRDEGREAAARALGYLARDKESVARLVQAGICSVLAKSLKEPPMKVQAVVAWAIGELCAKNPDFQDSFAENHVVRLLVGHVAFETIQEHSKYSIPTAPAKAMSLHSVVLAHTKSVRLGSSDAQNFGPSINSNNNNNIGTGNGLPKPNAPKTHIHSVVQSAMVTNGSVGVTRGRLSEDAETKAQLKAMAAYALWCLAKDNVKICKSITESRALLCFATLLEKGTGEVRKYSALAVMEIARVAEHNLALRQSAFKPSSPAAKAVVEQLLRIVQIGVYDELLLPCITSLGCLARTFQASETRIVGPLVQLLDEREPPVAKEAVIALTKFACTENHLHVTHCKTIIEGGGARHLVQLVYLGDQIQIEALVLLCYVALHVPDSEELEQAGVLAVLLWASKQAHMAQDVKVENLLPEAKARVELFQSRGTR
ncbi:armadillo repeat only 1 [Rhynchospora pubera]|uniref:Armadillo repeat only 1 n=1 Tax=Rhynchospora pubera TaxID=906938 RepID=A0AAV8F8H3_9POAL|nr:armadillo repeat only 1 [Rhynchospora pubera]